MKKYRTVLKEQITSIDEVKDFITKILKQHNIPRASSRKSKQAVDYYSQEKEGYEIEIDRDEYRQSIRIAYDFTVKYKNVGDTIKKLLKKEKIKFTDYGSFGFLISKKVNKFK